MEIRRKGWGWGLVPLAGRKRFASTLGEQIYLPPKRYDRPTSLATRDLIRHEYTHVRQWRSEWFWFWIKYLGSRRWRRRYEVEAYAEQCRFNPTSKRIQRYAGWLAGWRYGWLGRRHALAALIKAKVEGLHD